MALSRLIDGQFSYRPVLLVWAALVVLFLLAGANKILAGAFPDPDDSLRLVQVQDLLAGQGWFDLKQHRIDPTGSVPMHWSRLVDVPLLIVIAVLTPVVGSSLAEQAGAVLVPLLTMLATMIVIARIAWRPFGGEVALWACLSFGFLPMLVFQFQPMRIDHHGWQIFLVACAMWAIGRHHRPSAGALAGIAMGAGMIISLELLPVAAIFGAVLALRWLQDASDRMWLVRYLQALVVSMAVLFLATRGWRDLALYCDVITLPHLGLFAIVAAGVTGLALVPRVSPLALVGALAAIGGLGLAAFGYSSPECLRSPFGALDPLVHEFWYVNVLEGRPFWYQPPFAWPWLFQMIVALAAMIFLLLKARSENRAWWIDFALVFGGTFVLGLLVWRSMAFAGVLATIPLGILLKHGLMRFRTAPKAAQRLSIAAGLAVLLVPSAPLTAAMSAFGPKNNSDIKGLLNTSSCDLYQSVKALRTLPAGTIFAPLDIGPAIILDTPHSVVATGHHRADLAMRDVILGYTSRPDETRRIMKRHQAKYVVVCTDLLEPTLYRFRGGTGSFAHVLLQEEAPEWLEPVVLNTPATFKVWRIKD